MGVYIKGMDVPKSCADCMVSAQRCGLWVGFKEKTKRRSPYCPLVEVPAPHGRLIDADAVTREMVADIGKRSIRIDTAITVLEAEGKDNG